MTTTPSTNTMYIGIANTSSSTAPTGYASYTWSLYKGEKGDQGIQGPKGEDGKTTYTWIKYADTDTGAGMSDSPSGKKYIGMAFNKTTPTESTTASEYTWSLMPQNIEVGGKNIIINSSFANAIDGSERFTVGGVTYVNKRIPNWSNLYNSGIPNPTTSYHAIYRDSFEGKGPVIEFNESNGSRNWKALNAILRATDLSFGNYTFSADIYATRLVLKFGLVFITTIKVVYEVSTPGKLPLTLA